MRFLRWRTELLGGPLGLTRMRVEEQSKVARMRDPMSFAKFEALQAIENGGFGICAQTRSGGRCYVALDMEIRSATHSDNS